MASLQQLADSRYLLVTSYRRDGTPVATPVWSVPDGDAVAIWTPSSSGKVKRIRRDPKVAIATCDYRGGSAGETASGRAVILDAAGTARVRTALARKYGVAGRLTLLGSRLRRGRAGTVGIRITLDP